MIHGLFFEDYIFLNKDKVFTYNYLYYLKNTNPPRKFIAFFINVGLFVNGTSAIKVNPIFVVNRYEQVIIGDK
jgi:hypothetical protein